MEGARKKVERMQGLPGGAASGIRSLLRSARTSVTTVGLDGDATIQQSLLQLTGSDPWNSSSFAGLVVPTVATASLPAANSSTLPAAQFRYLFMLARQSFNAPERAWLRGIRQYASLFGYDSTDAEPFELEITSPMWHFPDGNISWHVVFITKTWRDKRNPLNADSLQFIDSSSPALLYQNLAPYQPPNAGRPWGTGFVPDLGNMHDLRWPYRQSRVESSVRIPIPAPCDVVVYASVFQHNLNPEGTPYFPPPTFSTAQAAAASPEDRFWAAFGNQSSTVGVQYGRIAASLIVEERGRKNPSDIDPVMEVER